MERYRSGHNGADSKSVCAQAHEGSNPSLSATQGTSLGAFLRGGERGIRTLFDLRIKLKEGSHSPLGDRQARLLGAERANLR